MTDTNRLFQDLFDQILNNEYWHKLPTFFSSKDLKSLRETIEFYRLFVPNLKFQLGELKQVGTGVSLRWTASGEHTGCAHGVAPSFQPIEIQGELIAEVYGGKIRKANWQWGKHSFLMQIGTGTDLPKRKTLLNSRLVGGAQSPTILLIPPMVAPGWVQWEVITEALRSNYRVINHDQVALLIAAGSAKRVPKYSVKTEVDELLRALKESGVTQPIHIVSFSMGGVMALELALKNSHLVKSLTLIEPSSPGIFGKYNLWPQPIKDFTNRSIQLMTGKMTEARVIKAYRHLKVIPDELSDADLKSRRIWPHVLYYMNGWNFREPIYLHAFDRAVLRDFDKPIFFIRGTTSPKFYHLILDELLVLKPNAQIQTIPGCHGPHLTKAGAQSFVELLDKFIREVERQ